MIDAIPRTGGAGAAISAVLAAFPPRIATPDEAMLEHVRSALGRNLPPPKLCRPHARKLVVAGGGPSLSIDELDREGVIVTINAGQGHLLANGVKPWAVGLLDARPHIADLIEPRPDMFWFVASTCHPSVFDKLRDCQVILWHPSGAPGIRDVLPEDAHLIAGGTTMGLRWINLGHYMGFRTFDLHGLDSSYRQGATHAYPDSRDGRQHTIEIDGFATDNNFLQQVADYIAIREVLTLDPDRPTLNLFGEGLLQHTVAKRDRLIASWPRRPASKPLNVVCVATGNYLGRGAEYVRHLKAGIHKHFRRTFDFHVIEKGPPNWWAKMQLFEPGRFPAGERVVYFDLDTVIVGRLDGLFDYDGPFAGLRDQWRPGQLGSGVMTWTAGELDHIWRAWQAEGCPMDDPDGDQGFISKHAPLALRLQDLLPGQMGSWKANFRQDAGAIPPDTRIVYFHGQPRPHETDLW